MSRALRGELNRILNAESSNLQRSVAAAGRQLAAIDALEADGRLAEQPYVVRMVADARRETPEATLADLAERLGLHRSGVQRALERVERLVLHGEARAISGMIQPCAHVIVAGNWKMNTSPGEASEPRPRAGGTDPGRCRSPHLLPAVREPGCGQGRGGIGCRRGAGRDGSLGRRPERPSRTRRGLYRRDRRVHARRPRVMGHRGPLRAPPRRRRNRRADRRQARERVGRWAPTRSSASARSSRIVRPAGPMPSSSDRSGARSPGVRPAWDSEPGRTPVAHDRLRAGLGDRNRAQRARGRCRRNGGRNSPRLSTTSGSPARPCRSCTAGP